MNTTKTLLQSRTLWANLIGILALGLSAAGYDAANLDEGALVEAALQIVAITSFLASSIFRIVAKDRLLR